MQRIVPDKLRRGKCGFGTEVFWLAIMLNDGGRTGSRGKPEQSCGTKLGGNIAETFAQARLEQKSFQLGKSVQ